MRAFLAVDLPEDVRRALAARVRELEDVDRGVRWTRPDTLHVTLRFLGAVDDERVPELVAAVTSAVAGFAPIALEITGGGAFPSLARPRVLWAGLAGDVDRLRDVAAAIEAAVAPGFGPADKPFAPHVTLGRAKSGHPRRVAAALAETPSLGTWTAREVVLFASETLPDGARHTAVARMPLSG